MGKKSKKGVVRTGKKHSAAGQSKITRSKSVSAASGSVEAKQVSRDAVSLDNPDIAPSNLPAPTGPPPQDVVAFINNLMQQQQAAVDAAKTQAGDNQFDKEMLDKENSVNATADVTTEEPVQKDEEALKKGGTAPEPSVAAEPEALREEEKEESGAVHATAAVSTEEPAEKEETLKKEDTAPEPVADVEPEGVKKEEKDEIAALDEPEEIDAVQPPNEETAAPEEPAEIAAVPVVSIPVVEKPPKDGIAAPVVVPDPMVHNEVVAVPVEPEVKEEPPKEDEAFSVVEGPVVAPEHLIVPPEEKIDVWSNNLRDVVAEEATKPVMDVTPRKPVVAATTNATTKQNAQIPTLDTPDSNDIAAKQNDCGGCVIL